MRQPLWIVACIVCGARSEASCYSLVTGRELPEGHTLRIWSQHEWDERHPEGAVVSPRLAGDGGEVS